MRGDDFKKDRAAADQSPNREDAKGGESLRADMAHIRGQLSRVEAAEESMRATRGAPNLASLAREARRRLDELLAAAEDAARRTGGAAYDLTKRIETRAEGEGPGPTYGVFQVGPKDRSRNVVLRDVPELNGRLPAETLPAEALPSFLSKRTKRAAASNRETPPAGDVARPTKPGAGSRGSGED